MNLHIMKTYISLTHNINIIRWNIRAMTMYFKIKPTQNNLKKNKETKQQQKQTNKQTKIKRNRLGRVNCA